MRHIWAEFPALWGGTPPALPPASTVVMQLQRRRLHHGSPLIVLQVTPYFTRCHATWPPAWCDAPSALCRTGAGQSGAIRLKGVVHAENNMLTLPYFLSQYASPAVCEVVVQRRCWNEQTGRRRFLPFRSSAYSETYCGASAQR